MSDILQIFTGNPLSTFIGKKVEAATRPDLESEDWSLNMEICDNINENDDDAKDAARAIRKRLQQIEQDRNFVITNRTLTVLETCVSNCSHRFHVLVMTKDFIQDLVKLIGPKNNPPIDLQERVLSLIERWAEAFKSQPDLNGVWSVYQDLKAKGVTFPQRDPSSSVPIQTPQRTVPAQLSHGIDTRASIQQQQMQQMQPIGQLILEGESYHKISKDLWVVQSRIDMLDEIMGLLDSPESEQSDWKLAEDLNLTCRQMRDRIVELIERVANEDLIIEFLRFIDLLNNLFVKYDRLVKNKSKLTAQTSPRIDSQASNVVSDNKSSAQTGQQSLQAGPADSGPRLPGVSSSTLSELSLIDFNAMKPSDKESTVVSQQDKGSQSRSVVTDPFDTSSISTGLVPSQSSGVNLDKAKSTSEAKSSAKTPTSLPEEISSVREQDFAEIENWLATDSGRNLNSIGGDMPSIEPISIPNSEFENFIANRALAGSGTSTQPGSKQPKPEPSD